MKARFFSKVHRGDGPDDCWLWQGARSHSSKLARNAYGQFKVEGRAEKTHRVAYELEKGSIPDGLTVDHLCGSTLCVNPAHLEAVPLGENIRRSSGRAGTNSRKGSCLRGHPFSGENLRLAKDGSRRCRACQRGYDTKWRTT
jgi:hypothetical protein